MMRSGTRYRVGRDEDGEIGGDTSDLTPELIGFLPDGLTPYPFTGERIVESKTLNFLFH